MLPIVIEQVRPEVTYALRASVLRPGLPPASARFDGMLCLRPARSVDAAAGQLIVREAGGAVSFPDAGESGPLSAGLDLDMRSRRQQLTEESDGEEAEEPQAMGGHAA